MPHADGDLERPKAFDGATTEVALKLSTEVWRFSEKDGSGRDLAVTGHLGAGASF